MSVDGRRREELRRATAEAAAAARRQLAAADGEAARRPGDLVLLPETAEHAVEWLLAERDGGRWLLVPADVDPWVGSGDHEVPADDDGGPLVLRCRHALWADARVLAGAVAGGRVDPAHAAAAAARHRQAEAGGLDGSPLERETDDDPLYRRRDAEVAAARALLAGAALDVERERQRRRFAGGLGSVATWRAAAAVLLVALVGAGAWVMALRGEVAELSAPRLIGLTSDIQVQWGATRSEVEVTPHPDARYIALDMVWQEVAPVGRPVRLVVADETVGEIWRSRVFRADEPGRHLMEIPRLPPGRYGLRLVTADASEEELGSAAVRVLPPP